MNKENEMITFVVWVLIAFEPSHGAPIVVDNIATAQNCKALGRSLKYSYTCQAVLKVKAN